MAILKFFDPPANMSDLTAPSKDADFRSEWSENVNRWTEAAILGDPWGSLNDQHRSFYYNPLATDIAGGRSVAISWFAFPNRILAYFPDASFEEQMGYAEGVHADGTYGPPPDVNGRAYAPSGPRGWQDEYCEWIAMRDASGRITQVDFTCENPEYWYTLWRFDPSTVLALYRQLVSPSVAIDDLYLKGSDGQPVVDRTTGRPAYNTTNKWNNQPQTGGHTGAVHLISPPNTLGAEIYLAAAATLPRDDPPGTPVVSPALLISCSRYGQANRNSDPSIGAKVNAAIRSGGVMVSLQNPVGLYIQMPDFSTFELPNDPMLPADAQSSDCWQIVRGARGGPGDAIDFILHARFALPKSWTDAGVSFTVGDIMIAGRPIRFGAQIAQTFQIALRGLLVPTLAPAQAPQPCVRPNPNPLPAPRQLQDLNLLNAQTTSTAALQVPIGETTPAVGLVASGARTGTTISFPEGGVTAIVSDFQDLGNDTQLFVLTLSAASGTAIGDQSVLLTNPDGTAGPPAPGLLTVVQPVGTTSPLTPQPGAVERERMLAHISNTLVRSRH